MPKNALRKKNSHPQKTLIKYKEKEEFVSNTIHKLRTPLAIIKGHVDLVLKDKSKISPALRDVFEDIDEEIRDLSAVLSDLTLLIMRNDNFKGRRFVTEKIRVSNIVDKVLDRFRPVLHSRNMKVKVMHRIHSAVQGDKRYIEKLFTNLINNAIKYSKKGSELTVTYGEKNKQLYVKIKDNGIGITKKDLKYIFERFYRAKQVHNITGMGLGLPIVKWIVEAHGGSVTAESTPGKGSTFTVFLPLM